jgi:CelD/BcsL family acetyltransferase involved in cellulose biosynthesis
MDIDIALPTELTKGDTARWREIQQSNPDLRNPFLSPDFSLAVGRARATARVAVVRDGGRTVGFLPFERRGRFVATAIGMGIADCTAFVHEPGFEWDARDLIRGCGLPVWEFDHLIAGQAPFAPHHTKRSGSPIMDLSEGYSAYLAARTRSHGGLVKDLQRRMRKLEREVGDVRFEFKERDDEALRALIRWKSAQYRRTRVPDQFSLSWVREVVEHLFSTDTPECAGTLSVLYAGDRRVAVHFGLSSSSIFSAWFPAYDPAFGRYSVGRALWLRLAERAAAEGAQYVDLGKGRAPYKEELMSRELEVASGRVAVSRPASTLRRGRDVLRSQWRRVQVRLRRQGLA